MNSRQRIWSLAVSLGCLLVMGWVAADYFRTLPPETEATYVGRSQCITCHQQEAKLYEGSHHDRAMELATDETVEGDFSGVEVEHYGVTSRFYRDGKKFMVRTEGPSGKMEDFEIKYVLGCDPLQQYMVEFDRSNDMPEEQIARVQVLRLSWDTHNKKWFHLDPPDVKERLGVDDDLHWTGVGQRWQTMCAECHSTNLKKNFDVKTASYRTTFKEIDVSCEACHGPGSRHVQIANDHRFFWDQKFGTGLTVTLKGADPEPQLQTCAHCHSRRQMLHENASQGDFWNAHDLERLHSDTYFADGQIRDEVYEYGSFIQSKMYHKAIRCTDCHDPHSAKLKATGNQLCTSCHQHPAGKYDSPSHHHHAPNSPGAQCVACHMPERTYMDVDPRRDHSIRIPRPDLSVAYGVPNACTGCHTDPKNVPEEKRGGLKDYAAWVSSGEAGDADVQQELKRADAWCDDACERWYGKERKKEPHFGKVLHAARTNDPQATKMLVELVSEKSKSSAMARASAVDELAQRDLDVTEWRRFMQDEHPFVRATAASALRAQDAKQAARSLAPYLGDPVRVVRTRLVQAIFNQPNIDPLEIMQEFSGAQREHLTQALEEYHDGLMTSSDRAGAHLNWALIQEGLRNYTAAIESYETAVRVEPRAVGPRSNLAALLENMAEAQGVPPVQAEDYRQRAMALRREELPLMERDANLAPTLPELQFRLGQLQYLTGDSENALQSFKKAIDLDPDEPRYRYMRMLLNEKLGREADAKVDREKLEKP